jgi:protein gp37
MSEGTKIEWTDATWNPIRGCSRVSEGCRNCYAEKVANRFCGPGQPYEGLVQIGADGKGNGKWNGQIKFVEKHLLDPLRWKKPQRIFVNSMSDLFHDGVTDEILDRIFAVMALCPQHTFQVLTKRPERMLAYFLYARQRSLAIIDKMADLAYMGFEPDDFRLPLTNVWLGVSVENQKAADDRLMFVHRMAGDGWQTMVSFEPLLGGIKPHPAWFTLGSRTWAIVGGESGPRARPMHPEWARSLRVKYIDRDRDDPDWRRDYSRLQDWRTFTFLNIAGGCGFHGERLHVMQRVGKKAAGNLLDGKVWNQFPR